MSTLISKTRQWASVIRFAPFETDTPEGRSKERLRRVALTAMVSAFAQAVNVLTMLISIPLTLNYLGAERYGLWVAISSLITVLGFADLGLGNGLLNAIAEANGRNDLKAAESYVSSAFFILTGVAILMGLIWFLVYPYISWNWLFNVTTPQALAETGPALNIFVWCTLVGLPLSLVQKIQDGYQEGYVNGLWRAGGSLVGLAGVLVAIGLRADLPWLVLAMAGAPVLALMLNTLLLFGRRRTWLLPRWTRFNQAASEKILRGGVLFFVLQLAVVVGFQLDNFVIARFLGASQVPQYAVPMRLFLLIPSLLSYAITPLWPAYGEAIARKDVAWIRKSFTHSLILSFVVSLPISLFLVIFGSRVIQFWVGPEIQPEPTVLIGLGIWVVLLSLGNPISMLLNGVNVVGFQVICATLMASGNLALSIYLVQKIGVSGPVYGSLISWLIFSFVPSLIYIPRLFVSWQKNNIETHET